jgi:adenine-specific DNA-methyltransferase
MIEGAERIALASRDIAAEKRQQLLSLFPEAMTDGGKIDFQRLKLALREAVDIGKERYGLSWPGKTECFKTIRSPSLGTLPPGREESVNFDTTTNLFIEDNDLEVLELLQPSYLAKAKIIRIDPSCDTGNGFIYPQ